MRVIYISHQISGDVENNIQRVETIVRTINLMYPDVFPYAHYLVECRTMNDTIQRERLKGIKNNFEVFKRGLIEELWLYGKVLSPGMIQEIEWARKYKIPITPKTDETSKEYLKLMKSYNK